MENLDNEYRTRSISRAAKLLKCFTMDRRELSLGDLSSLMGLHKSTVHRIVKTLEEEEMLVRNPARETYSIGMAIFQLGNIVRDSLELRTIALPVMERLAITVRESVFLSILSGGQKICIEKVEGPLEVRPTIKVGQLLPAHVGSSGKVLLAFLDEAEREAIISGRELSAFTDRTITDPGVLREELASIRAKGYALGFQERMIGGAGASAPVLGENGNVMGALTVVGPIQRITESGVDRIARMVFEAARTISRTLGNNRFITAQFEK